MNCVKAFCFLSCWICERKSDLLRFLYLKSWISTRQMLKVQGFFCSPLFAFVRVSKLWVESASLRWSCGRLTWASFLIFRGSDSTLKLWHSLKVSGCQQDPFSRLSFPNTHSETKQNFKFHASHKYPRSFSILRLLSFFPSRFSIPVQRSVWLLFAADFFCYFLSESYIKM